MEDLLEWIISFYEDYVMKRENRLIIIKNIIKSKNISDQGGITDLEHQNKSFKVLCESFKEILKEWWIDFKNWLFEPWTTFLEAENNERLWIPFFIVLSSVPVFIDNDSINNAYTRPLYNLLLIYFSAYLSSKIPHNIKLLRKFYFCNKDKRCLNGQYDGESENQHFFKGRFISFSCSEIRTLYAILLFIYSIYLLNAMHLEDLFDYVKYLFVFVIAFLLLNRTILYILKSFLPREASAAEVMESQILTTNDILENSEEGVRILR